MADSKNHIKFSPQVVLNRVFGEDEEAMRVVQGFNVPKHDYIALTYVASGNGSGEIETVTYKKNGASGTTVGTLTLAYDASNNISTVTLS